MSSVSPVQPAATIEAIRSRGVACASRGDTDAGVLRATAAALSFSRSATSPRKAPPPSTADARAAGRPGSRPQLQGHDGAAVRAGGAEREAGRRGDPVRRQHHGPGRAARAHPRSPARRRPAARGGRPGGRNGAAADVGRASRSATGASRSRDRACRRRSGRASPALGRHHGHVRARRRRSERARRGARRAVVLTRPTRRRARPCATAVRGWRAGGVAATAKHFPGLGAAPANTDDAIVTIRRSRAALDAVDLPPFAAAIAAGVPLVMVGHARYPASTASGSPRSRDRSCTGSSARSSAFVGSSSRTRSRRRRRLRPGASRRCPSARCAPAPISSC